MSKPDKHIPLSAEELFKLLDQHPDRASDFDGMDDFEKEALEGFTAFSTPARAKELVSEVNTAISQKASGAAGKKTRIIWFSAAASIVLLVLLSVFFLDQRKEDTASNLALNELPPVTQNPVVSPVPGSEPPVETKEQSTRSDNMVTDGQNVKGNFEQELAVTEKKAEEKGEGPGYYKEAAPAEMKALEESAGLSTDESNVVAANSSNQKNTITTKDADDLKQAPVVAADKLAAVKPESAGREVVEETKSYHTVATGSTRNDELQKNSATKADAAKQKESYAKKRSNYEKSPAYSTTETDMDADVRHAYYTGGELAIRDFVNTYLKQSSITITGKYKVKAIVNASGKLKVNSIAELTKEKCGNCVENLRNALNTMKDWNPALWDNNATESTVEFIIAF